MRHLRTLSRSLLSSISLGTIVLGCATNTPTQSALVDSDSAIHSESLAFTSSDGVACLVADNKPSLWFPLDGIDAVGNARDAAEGLDGRIVSQNSPSFHDGPVGTHIEFDGETHVQVDDADRIDSPDGGFSFGAWVNPATSSAGTIASHGQYGAPGTWRLLAQNDTDLVFEVCDPAGCSSQILSGGAPTGAWSFVMLSANVVSGEDASFVQFTLKSNAGGDAELVLSGATPIDSRFGFRVPAPMSIGASLLPLYISPPTPTEEGLDVPYGPVEPFTGGIDEAMYFNHVLAESAFGEFAGALPSGICEDCIHDVTPPTIVCPENISVPAGEPITPAAASATDNCDDHPTIVMAMSSTVPGKAGDITTITYTAIDASGNQASCTSEVEAYTPPPPAANKTIITGGSCQLSITPGGAVTSGSQVSINVIDNSFQCTGGTCDITRTFYVADPGGPFGSGTRYVGTVHSNNMTGNSGPHGSDSARVYTDKLLDVSSSIATVVVTARDSVNQQVLKTWVCGTSVPVQPEVTSYCGQPISYWRNAVDTGQVNLLVLNPSSGGSGAPWYDGTNTADLIIGNTNANKIRGNGGNDCIWGGAGADTINGNDGNDLIEGGPGNDIIHGNNGQDTIWGGADRDEIHGDDNSDWIDGGSESDWLYGEVDDDTIFGGHGDDRIWGGWGTDTIDGGDHNDLIWGEEQPDTIIGGSGCDRIEGGSGADDINGNGGQDRLRGNAGADHIHGGNERDYIRGDSGDNEVLGGGDGDDLICGDAGVNETLNGGNGWDICNPGPGWGTFCDVTDHSLDCDDSLWMYSTLSVCQ